MTYAKKVDANQKLIVQTFRDLGCLVSDTSAVGKGFPDLVIQRRKPMTGMIENLLVEIKDGRKPPSKRRLTKSQVEFHAIWNVHIVESVQDVYSLLDICYQD